MFIETLKNMIFILFLLSHLFHSCAMDAPEKGYDYLAPPVITNAFQSQMDNKKIVVEFRGYNNEYYFDGYNIYISTSNMNRNNIRSYKYVQVDGYTSAEPSFPLSPEEYDPDLTREAILYHYYRDVEDMGDIPFPFEEGTTYYILLCSHHRFGEIFPEGVSNQVSVEFGQQEGINNE
ncbi:MAG: hypothetical protein SVZ03_01325 [Spirochaetota bacterium]|nr:hypothetical protein [Spirochaetota bacterium]